MNYSIEMAEKLAEAGWYTWKSGPESKDAARTVLYLGLLSCELTLKALLERAGVAVKTLRGYSHEFERILSAFGDCTIAVAGAEGSSRRVPASRVRSLKAGQSTVGEVLLAESRGASKYPNQVRYGDKVVHVPPVTVLSAADSIIRWSRGPGATIQVGRRP